PSARIRRACAARHRVGPQAAPPLVRTHGSRQPASVVLALQAPRGEQEARSATLPLEAPPTRATAQAERPRAYRETSRVASAQRTEPSDRCRRTQGAREEQASAGQ